MKRILTLFVFLCLHLLSHAQAGIWTWVQGAKVLNDPGHIGTMAVPSSANYPEGRYQAAQWQDLNGNFWIFGGLDNTHEERNDLWKYDPVANTWVWINGSLTARDLGDPGTLGVPSPNNLPSARGWGIQTWVDRMGGLWLNGGYGYDQTGTAGVLADMWMYDIPSNQWTQMNDLSVTPIYGAPQVGAPGNSPGGRQECNTVWTKSDGTIWIFGGCINLLQDYDDVWKFDMNTNNWAWMSGQTGINRPYDYGTMDVETASNRPSARGSYSHWQDANDTFYIFGGQGFSNHYDNNDIWKYNTTNNRWTWIGGDSSGIYSPGYYNQTCAPGGGIVPKPRYENRTAQLIGCHNVFWTFGGAAVGVGAYNDLWAYDIASHQWIWASGDSLPNGLGNYGSKGVPSAINQAPARSGECLWMDSKGVMWMWGGMAGAGTDKFSDMWKFVPDTTCIHEYVPAPLSVHLSDSIICPHDSSYLVVSGGAIVSVSPSADVSLYDSAHITFSPASSTGYTLAIAGPCGVIDTFRYNIQVSARRRYISQTICRGAQVNFEGQLVSDAGVYTDTVTGGSGCDTIVTLTLTVDSVPDIPTIRRAGNLLYSVYTEPNYQWQYNGVDIGTDTTTQISIIGNGVYTLIVSNVYGCSTADILTVTNAGINTLDDTQEISIYPNPATKTCSILISNYNGESYTARLTDMTGKDVSGLMNFSGTSFTFPVAQYASGVYILHIWDSRDGQFIKKLVVE